MNCQRCETPNEENVSVCVKCGANLRYPKKKRDKTQTSDSLIIIFLIYMFTSTFTQFALQKMDDNWYQGDSKYIIIGLNIVWAFSPILLGIAIQNKRWKQIGIILASICTIYILYVNMKYL